MSESEAPELATTRSMFAAWNESDVERMTEFWTEDGDWIWEDPPDLPDAQKVGGREAVTARLVEIMSLIGGMRLEIDRLSMIGDEVFAEVHAEIDGAKSGVHLVDDTYSLIRYEDGRVRRYRTFTTREQALAAADTR